MAQSFNRDMRAAAYRHQDAAEKLYVAGRQDVAGYLYGLATECGVKALMLAVGMRPLMVGNKGDDPFYAHFTRLKAMLKDDINVRRHNDLRKFTDDDRFMEHWDVGMRYSDGKDIRSDWVDRWRQNAKDALAEI